VPQLSSPDPDGNLTLPILPGEALVESGVTKNLVGAAESAASSMPEMVRDLGFGGPACVLWTTVVCVAFLKSDACTVRWLWLYLFLTWIGLVALWLGGQVIVAIGQSRATGNAPQLDSLRSGDD
jgi:hypothetical protein